MKQITPLIDLQRTLKREGKIRMGARVKGVSKAGKEYTRPDKLTNWRFTSANRSALEHVAEMYGGEVTPWAEEPGQFELFSNSSEIFCNLMPGISAPRVSYEYWTAKNCQRRCDGITCQLATESTDGPVLQEVDCLCQNRDYLLSILPQQKRGLQGKELEQALADVQCKQTTRVAVQLAGTLALGVWTLESHGFYAMTEFAPTVETFLQFGRAVLVKVAIEPRESKDRAGMLRQFIVPVVRIENDMAEGLRAIGGLPIAELIGAGAPALPQTPRAIETSGVWADPETGERVSEPTEGDPFLGTEAAPVDPGRAQRETDDAMLDEQLRPVMETYGFDSAENKKPLSDLKAFCALKQLNWKRELLGGVDAGFKTLTMIRAHVARKFEQ